jgi:4-amino-4-deoxy-L-arabinose transferase-like glycosyltransferase
MNSLRKMWNEHPLSFVLLVGLIVRLIAAYFSRGFLMHDDHFLIIESTASWADGYDNMSWLPWEPYTAQKPQGHSMFYIGLHYLFFEFSNLIGLNNPQLKMLVIRFGHAFYSLLTIFLSYKIAERISDWKTARLVGIVLALLAFFPNYAVRNLVEMVTIPPLLWSTWLLLREQSEKRFSLLVWAAVLGGIAVGIRYQSVLFVGGLGLVLLIQKKWLGAIAFGVVSFAVFFLTQIGDLFIWGRPFAELWEYIVYNMEHGSDYLVQPWYNYLLVLAGFLIPPVSLFILFGFFREWKRHLLIFLPTLIFLVIHSAIGNKQERFIVPIMPFIVILGLIGWQRFVVQSTFWQNRQKLLRGCWIFFWVLNGLALIVLTTSYNKKSRVEAMSYLYEQGNLQNFVVEASHTNNTLRPPLYYSGQWADHYYFNKKDKLEKLKEGSLINAKKPAPNYVIFYEDENLEERVQQFRKLYPSLEHKKTIDSGFFDRLLHELNPHNRNYRAHIYYFNELEGKGSPKVLPRRD